MVNICWILLILFFLFFPEWPEASPSYLLWPSMDGSMGESLAFKIHYGQNQTSNVPPPSRTWTFSFGSSIKRAPCFEHLLGLQTFHRPQLKYIQDILLNMQRKCFFAPVSIWLSRLYSIFIKARSDQQWSTDAISLVELSNYHNWESPHHVNKDESSIPFIFHQ